MNVLTFRFEVSLGSNDHEVRPMIDGKDVLNKDFLGLDPPEYFNQPKLFESGDILIGRCKCGVVGCDDIRIKNTISSKEVTWNLKGGKKYIFSKKEYFESINHSSNDSSWENNERKAERLVSYIDFSTLAEYGYEFNWASARISKGCISLSFEKDNTQRIFDIGWNPEDPDDAVRNVTRWVIEYV